MLDADITIGKLGLAVKSLANNKSPSTDGLPIDCYKAFWSKIKNLLYELYQDIISSNELYLSARRGIISLLEKVGRNSLQLKSWCPLTLLNSDYKIFSKVLALRLQKVLNTVIHESQTGFVKGRFIAENTIKILNLMEHCERTGKSAVVISIDFEKAFDQMEWPAIDAALTTFGVGPKFRKMIQILYKNPVRTVLNNGTWSNWIYPTRGCRQGDPISSILYIITAETLGIKLRSNIKIKGIQISNDNDTYLLSVQYADDTWLALESNEQNINEALHELEKFCKFSGLTINYQKSVAFILGPLRDTDPKYYMMKQLFWSDGPVKILGISLHPNKEVLMRENYWKALDKIEEILQSWTHRSLSLQGKIVVINNLVASQLVYKFMSLPTPDAAFFKKYKQIILQFLWGDKPHRIKYQCLIQNYNKSGLKLIDIESKNHALKAAWIYRWKQKERLAKIPWLYINLPIQNENIWKTNLNQRDIKNYIRVGIDMGIEIWKSWSVCNFIEDLTFENIESMSLWYNSKVRRADSPFFNNALMCSSMNTMIDMWNMQENRYLTFEETIDKHGGVIDKMLYNSLITAIPKLWKHTMKEWVKAGGKVALNELHTSDQIHISRTLYWQILEKQYAWHNDSSPHLWAIDLKANEDELRDNWEKIMLDARSTSNASKLRILQYKLLTRSITTAVRQAKWDNVSPKCSFCQEEMEMIMHLFVECHHMKKLWSTLSRWIGYFYQTQITFTPRSIIINDLSGYKSSKLLNTFVLIMKQYICSAKCKKGKPEFIKFISTVNYWYNIEKIAAIYMNRYITFKNKWKMYVNCN